MGGCVSAPAKADDRKKHKGIRIERPRSKKAPRSIPILESPDGNNISDKYRMGKELGRGEFGITHQCFNLETGETFACKMIPKSKLRTEIDIEDVRREVEIMRHLPEHPNIVTFKEAFEDKDNIYLVMELCEGGELFDRIVSRGHYTERAAAKMTRTIIEVCKVRQMLKFVFIILVYTWYMINLIFNFH